MLPFMRSPAIALLLALLGCQGPMDVADLSEQQAELAEEGQADMRSEDGTLGDVQTDSLTADGYGEAEGLGADPFLVRQRKELDSTRLNEGGPLGAAAILEPGPESTGGQIPSTPGGQFEPG
jgi:hypothetical protein